jgi:hypothetical protein
LLLLELSLGSKQEQEADLDLRLFSGENSQFSRFSSSFCRSDPNAGLGLNIPRAKPTSERSLLRRSVFPVAEGEGLL